MVRKQTWILLVVFAILLGVAFYLTKNPLPSLSGETTPTATEMAVILPQLQSSDVTGIDIKDSSTVMQLKRDSTGKWTLDGKDPVESGRIDQLLSELLAFRSRANLAAGYDQNVLGLISPARTLTLTTSKGDTHIVRIGKLTPTEAGYYVQADQQAPAVIDKGAVDSLLNLITRASLLNWTPTPEPSGTPEMTGTPQPAATNSQQTPTP